MMDISADKYESDSNRLDPFLAVMQIIWGIIGRLIGFFTLTEADRLKAGIYYGGEERD
jgi:hypothetical protein